MIRAMAIIRLGAIADLDPSGNGDPRQLRISVSEFIDTEDGRRIVLNADRGYTVTGDGQRFLFVTSAEDASVPPFTVVLNWMEVKR